MTVVFWFLVLVFIVAIWFLAYSLFGNIGRMFLHIFDNAKNGLNEKEHDESNDPNDFESKQ